MGISDDEAGLASGLINTSQQIGGAVGVALLATVFTSRTAELRASGTAADVAFTDGLSRAFLVGALMAVLGLVAALVLIRGGSPEAEQAAAEALGPVRRLARSGNVRAAAALGKAAAAAGRRLRDGVGLAYVLTRRIGDQAQAGVLTVTAFAAGLTCASGPGVRVRPGCALLALALEAREGGSCSSDSVARGRGRHQATARAPRARTPRRTLPITAMPMDMGTS